MKSRRPKQEEERVASQFRSDIASHELRVELDNSVHRHLVCQRPGTRVYSFAITTWPGHLAVTGDMGSFVFCRLADMFEFFRTGRGEIAAGYWREKLVAIDRGGALEYDADLFRDAIVERYKDWRRWSGADYNADQRRELRERIRNEVLSRADDGEHAAHDAAYRFEYEDKELFPDFWETNLKTYTYHFLWCCHAIRWAIAQYDARLTLERAA